MNIYCYKRDVIIVAFIHSADEPSFDSGLNTVVASALELNSETWSQPIVRSTIRGDYNGTPVLSE